jgi:uncharacterized lipoprotein YddW (UPF0748 family)
MPNRALFVVLLLASITIAVSCSTFESIQPVKVAADTPKDSDFQPIDREFRAAWIATVANINWPSRPGLPVDSQKIEAIALLDTLAALNMNAAIFQVRPQADALYPSEHEPWSYFLSGKQGQAPSPYYDPLQFWIDEAHKRGIELHAWLNPYRAHHITGDSISAQSIVRLQPDWVVELKNGYHWFIPTKKEAQDQTYTVVMDLVERYDLDGIHFDDYFYPYPSYNEGDDFPDDAEYQKYLASGGLLTKGDWRRDAVNTLMQRVYRGIKSVKPSVKFGLSPFGIWRPGFPASIQGFDQYEGLYADAKLWLNKGWIDYFAPQLYWPINRIPQSYPVLLSWWESENTLGRHLWPGVSIGQFNGEKRSDEVLNIVQINRGIIPKSPGMVHWSIAPLMTDTLLVKSLKEGPYKEEALVPESPWLDKVRPAAAQNVRTVVLSDSTLQLRWDMPKKTKREIFQWVVYAKYGNKSTYHSLVSASTKEMIIPLAALPKVYGAKEKVDLTVLGVSAVSRTGMESDIEKVNIVFEE